MYWSFWQFPNFLRMQKFNLCNLIFRNLAVWTQSKITHCMVYLVKSSRYIVHSLYILYPLNSKKIYRYNNCSRYRVLIYKVTVPGQRLTLDLDPTWTYHSHQWEEGVTNYLSFFHFLSKCQGGMWLFKVHAYTKYIPVLQVINIITFYILYSCDIQNNIWIITMSYKDHCVRKVLIKL